MDEELKKYLVSSLYYTGYEYEHENFFIRTVYNDLNVDAVFVSQGLCHFISNSYHVSGFYNSNPFPEYNTQYTYPCYILNGVLYVVDRRLDYHDYNIYYKSKNDGNT